MLRRADVSFTKGRSKFSDRVPGIGEQTAKIYVKVQFGGTDLTFLGYSGPLDGIRFALDPQANDFYFGVQE